VTLAEYKKLILERSEIVLKLQPLRAKASDVARKAIPLGSTLVAVDFCLDHVAATYRDENGMDTAMIPIDKLFEGE